MQSIMDILYIPLGYLMRGLYGVFGNYLATLLVFAVIIKLILFPFSIKQQRNSQKQAKLRPKEAAIRKKYAGRTDKATQTKMQEEVLALYRSEGFNPASGCLPLLIQFPILLAVFRVVTAPLTYILRIGKENIEAIKEIATKLAETAGSRVDAMEINWIKEIVLNRDSQIVTDGFAKIEGVKLDEIIKFHDNFDFFGTGINLLDKPTVGLNWLILIPILTFVIVYGSMKLTRKFTYQPSTGNEQQDNATASSMKIMDLMMPLMSVWFSFMYPAAIGIYWMMQNLLGSVQQFALYKLFPIPKCSEEEYRAAELALRGKTEKNKNVKKRPADEVKELPKKSSKDKGPKNKKAFVKKKVLAKVRETGRVPMAKKKI